MNSFWKMLLLSSLFLTACEVKRPEVNHYQLTGYSTRIWAKTASHKTLSVTLTDAVDGFETNQMQYTVKPFELNSFSKNNWASPPANMIYPLLIQSLQRSGYFSAIASGNYVTKSDYRLDTQLISLKQSFIFKPSIIDLNIKAIVTRLSDNHVIGSHVFIVKVTCSQDTPYGGVLAANKATEIVTGKITRYVIRKVSVDTRAYA